MWASLGAKGCSQLQLLSAAAGVTDSVAPWLPSDRFAYCLAFLPRHSALLPCLVEGVGGYERWWADMNAPLTTTTYSTQDSEELIALPATSKLTNRGKGS